MKHVLYIIAIAIIALPAQAAVVVTNITHDQFDDFFSYQDSRTVTGSTAVWYAQIQAGGLLSHEIEVGGTGNATDTGETSWNDGANNPFSLVIDSANYLKLTFNGVTAGDGYQVPIGHPFNEIWVEIQLRTGDPDDVLSVNSQVVDGPASLPPMSVTGSNSGTGDLIKTSGFKFYFDDHLSNIGQFSFNGGINPNMFIDGIAFQDDWTYTFVGVYNTALVPEPSTIGLIIASMLVVVMLCGRKQSSYPPVG